MALVEDRIEDVLASPLSRAPCARVPPLRSSLRSMARPVRPSASGREHLCAVQGCGGECAPTAAPLVLFRLCGLVRSVITVSVGRAELSSR